MIPLHHKNSTHTVHLEATSIITHYAHGVSTDKGVAHDVGHADEAGRDDGQELGGQRHGSGDGRLAAACVAPWGLHRKDLRLIGPAPLLHHRAVQLYRI
jgi:hypothetical protein